MKNQGMQLAAAAALGLAAQTASAAVGLTADGRLIAFGIAGLPATTEIGPVTGFVGGDTALIGIDYRVQDRQLYGVGNAGGVYTIRVATAALSFVNTIAPAPSGTRFGVDFNPAADRLRIVSDTGQNLRHNVNAGGTTTVDGNLNYTAGIDAANVIGAAYTNNDLDTNTGTTLFNIDTGLDQVVLQVPPNNGSLAATGKLGLDASGAVGFDIRSRLNAGATVANVGYAAVTGAGGDTALYRVNLLTGALTLVGDLPDGVVDIAFPTP